MAFPKPPVIDTSNRLPREPGVTDHEISQLDANDISFILKDTLTPGHYANAEVKRFIKAYLQCRDTRQAAKESNIKHVSALAMLQRQDIRTAIDKITDQALLRYGLDPNEIVEKVKEIAFFDPAQICKPDGTIIENLHEIPPETRRAIKKFTAENIYDKDPNGMPIIKGRLIKVEFWDKLRGNELLGREVDLFKETTKVTHDVSSNMKDILLESKARAEQRAIESRAVRVIELSPAPSGVTDTVVPSPVEKIDEKHDTK